MAQTDGAEEPQVQPPAESTELDPAAEEIRRQVNSITQAEMAKLSADTMNRLRDQLGPALRGELESSLPGIVAQQLRESAASAAPPSVAAESALRTPGYIDEDDRMARLEAGQQRILTRFDDEENRRTATERLATLGADVRQELTTYAADLGIVGWESDPRFTQATAHLKNTEADWQEIRTQGLKQIGRMARDFQAGLATQQRRQDGDRVTEAGEAQRQAELAANRTNGVDQPAGGTPSAGPEPVINRLQREVRQARIEGKPLPEEWNRLVKRGLRGELPREELA